MATFNYPFQVTKDTPAVAVEVQTNFDDLLAWLKANFLQADGTVAMTGPLVLAPGVPGAPDHAANKAYVDASMPVGMIVEYAGTALPGGWLWCDGQTYSNTSQPLLAAAIGRSFTLAAVPANSFSVPDKRKRVTVGADATEAAVFGLGKTGGQRNSELLSHAHVVPVHGHGASGTGSSNQVDLWHQHAVNIITSTAGSHGHSFGNNSQIWYDNSGGVGFALANGFGAAHANFTVDGAHNHGVDGHTAANWLDGGRYHSHTISVGVTVNNAAAFDTTLNGDGSTRTDKNLQPYIAINSIIFAGGM